MARTKRNPPLNVFMNGRMVGTVQMARSGAISFAYHESWLTWSNAMPISLSMPLDETAYAGGPVIAFLENLLPDNQAIRDRVAARVGAEGTDAYHMLEKIGRDCVGALQFVVDGHEAGDPTTHIEGVEVDARAIAESLKNLAAAPLGMNEEDDFRISIAGAQEKTALLRFDGKWLRPMGMTPTTHILKTQLGVLPNGIDLTDSVENEFFCMRFCRHMGADVAHVEIHDFEDVRSLVVERFDRHWTSDGRLLRLPQEDCCQALGVPPSRKYESDGGPGIAAIVELLKGSDRPIDDQKAFFHAQILFWMLGATDGHAKNFSVALKPSGRFALTPLYDILSAQKALGDGELKRNRMKLAMAVGENRHYVVHEVVPRHFLQSAKANGVSVGQVEELLDGARKTVDTALQKTRDDLPENFSNELADILCEGIYDRTRALELSIT